VRLLEDNEADRQVRDENTEARIRTNANFARSLASELHVAFLLINPSFKSRP
jgi:hypothetical protein